MFGRFVCLFVCPSVALLINNKRICMKLLPGVCLGPWNNLLDFADDLVYDANPGSEDLFRSKLDVELVDSRYIQVLARRRTGGQSIHLGLVISQTHVTFPITV